jgi:hypothetical protein
MTHRRLAAAGLLLLALAGCKPPTKVDPSFSFQDKDDQAVVLLGIKADPSPSGQFTRLGVTFQRFDPQTNQMIAGPQNIFSVIATRCPTARSCSEYLNDAPIIWRMPAGHYVLKTVTAYNDNARPRTVKVTSLVGVSTNTGLFGSTRQSVPTSGSIGNGLRYYFAPSEVVYLGDYVFDAIKFPASLRAIRRDDSAAERARAARPGLATAAWVFRMPNNEAGQPMQIRDFAGSISSNPNDHIHLDSPSAGTGGTTATNEGVLIQSEQ